MKRIATVFVVVLCAFALTSSVAFADQCSMDKSNCSMGKGNFMPKFHKMWSKKGHDRMFFREVHLALSHAKELGLSDDQVSNIKALEYTFKKSLIKENADIKTLGLDIREAITKGTVDTNAVNSLIDQKYALKAAKAKEVVQAYANLKKILTKDQYDKLKEMRHQGMWGKRKEEKKACTCAGQEEKK